MGWPRLICPCCLVQSPRCGLMSWRWGGVGVHCSSTGWWSCESEGNTTCRARALPQEQNIKGNNYLILLKGVTAVEHFAICMFRGFSIHYQIHVIRHLIIWHGVFFCWELRIKEIYSKIVSIDLEARYIFNKTNVCQEFLTSFGQFSGAGSRYPCLSRSIRW